MTPKSIWPLIAALLLASATPALADSILLGQINENSGAAGSAPPSGPVSANFFLLFGVPGNFIPPLSTIPNCVGCALSFPTTIISATAEFDASNTPEFNGFVQQFVNAEGYVDSGQGPCGGSSGGLSDIECLNLFALAGVGVGSGNTVSQWFGTPNAFTNGQIESIDLIVNSFFYNTGGGCNGNQMQCMTANVTWQFYGTESSPPSTVPEPSFAPLVLAMMGFLIFWRREHQRRMKIGTAL
jgi:hypothetical protein